MAASDIQTNLQQIALAAEERTGEHEQFRDFLLTQDAGAIDQLVFNLNETVSAQVDCTQCGNCCRSFMINVSKEEAGALADHFKLTGEAFKTTYLEESLQGNLIMKSIPCSFLSGNVCTVYPLRFSGCREFPHLDRPGFTGRLFGTLQYYATCPIIFNVVEQLKTATGFNND